MGYKIYEILDLQRNRWKNLRLGRKKTRKADEMESTYGGEGTTKAGLNILTNKGHNKYVGLSSESVQKILVKDWKKDKNLM